jgi:hypothetical protein
MDHSTRPDVIAGAPAAVLAVTATALVFLSNAEMAWVPMLQLTAYRWALYGLLAVMIALWIELLVPRFRGAADEDGRRPPAGLGFATGLSESARRWAWRLWFGGLALAVLTALLLAVCGALNRRGIAVPLDAVELGLALLAWPAACLLALSALLRRGWVRL